MTTPIVAQHGTLKTIHKLPYSNPSVDFYAEFKILVPGALKQYQD